MPVSPRVHSALVTEHQLCPTPFQTLGLKMCVSTMLLKACFSQKEPVLGFAMFPSRLFLQYGVKEAFVLLFSTQFCNHICKFGTCSSPLFIPTPGFSGSSQGVWWPSRELWVALGPAPPAASCPLPLLPSHSGLSCPACLRPTPQTPSTLSLLLQVGSQPRLSPGSPQGRAALGSPHE